MSSEMVKVEVGDVWVEDYDVKPDVENLDREIQSWSASGTSSSTSGLRRSTRGRVKKEDVSPVRKAKKPKLSASEVKGNEKQDLRELPSKSESVEEKVKGSDKKRRRGRKPGWKVPLEEQRRRKRELRRQKYQEEKLKNSPIPEMEREKRSEMYRQRALERKNEEKRKLESMNDEEREKYLEEKQKKYFYSLSQRLNMSEEEKERRRIKSYFKYHARSKEEKERQNRMQVERSRRWRANLKDESKVRFQESCRKAVKKQMAKIMSDPERRAKYYDYLKKYQRKKTANETPEERQKRLWRYKVYQAKVKLKRKLEGEGVNPEVIEKKVGELHEEMWRQMPPPTAMPASVYTPRPRKGNDGNNSESSATSDMNMAPRSRRSNLPKIIATRSIATTNQIQSKESHSNECKFFGNETGATYILPNAPIITSFQEDSDSGVKSGNLEGEREIDQMHMDGSFDDYPASPELEVEEHPQNTEALKAENDNIFSTSSVPIESSLPSMEVINLYLKCPHCLSLFEEDTDLRQHIASDHPSLCWKCPKCKETMLNPAELSQHYKTHHFSKTGSSNSEAKVKKERDVNIKKSKTKTEEPSTSKSLKFTCVKCPPNSLKFSSSRELSNHVQTKHPQSYWPCPNCDILKYSEKSLVTHKKLCQRYSTKKK